MLFARGGFYCVDAMPVMLIGGVVIRTLDMFISNRLRRLL